MFSVKYTQNGKQKWATIGKASEGITEEYAYQRRIDILNKIIAGEAPHIRGKRGAATLEQMVGAYLVKRFVRCIERIA